MHKRRARTADQICTLPERISGLAVDVCLHQNNCINTNIHYSWEQGGVCEYELLPASSMLHHVHVDQLKC